MRINYNKFLSLVYADIFDWPLTQSELRDWRISDKKKITKQVEYKNGYFFLPGKEKFVKQRQLKEETSAKKKIIAGVIVGFLAKIPTIEAIFLTGSVAMGSAKKGGDIDLMIITSPNTLWLTRMIVVVLLKGLRSYGNDCDQICPNIFLDLNHLEIKEKNLYTAHEILQAICLFDRSGVEKLWLKKNFWTNKYLPSIYKLKLKNLKLISNFKLQIVNYFWIPAELVAFTAQYFYMKSKITSEHVGWGYAFFHPNNLSEKTLAQFGQRLVKYNN